MAQGRTTGGITGTAACDAGPHKQALSTRNYG